MEGVNMGLRRLAVTATLGAIVPCMAIVGVRAAPQNTCPPDPPPGSTVNGGLLVTGMCHLDNVRVNGGIVVTGTGQLEVENSVVNGGIDVQPGGELDVGHTLFSYTATFTPSTINGGIRVANASDLDVEN